MNESFEVLPFGAAVQNQWGQEWEQEWQQEWEQEDEGEGEAEWEDERWRGAGGGRGRGGRLRPRPPLRGPRRPVPPRYRGWGSYPVAYPVLYPAPQPAPQPEPWNDQDDSPGADDGDGDGQDEVPPVLAATLGRVREAAGLHYQSVGKLVQAVGNAKAIGPGLYLIEFDTKDGRRAYSGQTDDLRRRLKQHHLCGKMMGLDLSGHEVYVAPLKSAEQRRLVEKSIHADMFTHRRGVLTNQRRELEMAVMGELWG